jgi:hypothetical protein
VRPPHSPWGAAPSRPALPTVRITVHERALAHRVSLALAELRFPHLLASPDPLGDSGDERSITCFSVTARTARLGESPAPALLISPGTRTVTEILPVQSAAVTLPIGSVGPASLLKALVVAGLGTQADFVATHLAEVDMWGRVPPDLIQAFLREPTTMRGLRDVRHSLNLSRAKSQELIRCRAGLGRAEHLFAALRCATWVLMIGEGLARLPVEEYLCITDRPTFRRACRRAGVPAPHLGMSLAAFSSQTHTLFRLPVCPGCSASGRQRLATHVREGEGREHGLANRGAYHSP